MTIKTATSHAESRKKKQNNCTCCKAFLRLFSMYILQDKEQLDGGGWCKFGHKSTRALYSFKLLAFI